jgi:hypothetical protein
MSVNPVWCDVTGLAWERIRSMRSWARPSHYPPPLYRSLHLCSPSLNSSSVYSKETSVRSSMFQFGLPPLRRQEPVEAAVTTWSWITAFPHDFDSNSGIIGQKSQLIRWRAPVGSLEVVIVLARPWSAAMLPAYETKVCLLLSATRFQACFSPTVLS